MSNIRFRRFSSASQKGWELDCIVLPSDEMNGELIHYGSKKAVDFREEFQTGFFAALDRLLDSLTDPGETPRDQVRLVLGRLKDGQRNHYSLKALDEYCAGSQDLGTGRRCLPGQDERSYMTAGSGIRPL